MATSLDLKLARTADYGRFSFLDLPAEIRLMVYAYFTPEHHPRLYRGLLLACKRTYAENKPEMLKAAKEYCQQYERDWIANNNHSNIIAKPSQLGWAVVVFNPTYSDLCNMCSPAFTGARQLPLITSSLNYLEYTVARITAHGLLHPIDYILYRMCQVLDRSHLRSNAPRIVHLDTHLAPSLYTSSKKSKLQRSKTRYKDGKSSYLAKLIFNDTGDYVLGIT
ncbi:hypothetical protein EK21DRAFT_119205 [Setomelanomma holmii]|uniref:Uncharacterized protein n=1 Tax=Setomelanomma holmii TaxID=210430 RepID=A0A9P4LG84_9PLEO|nr:hypothetical protein EK21DRAFT_119205 [Setomelanomma holmii]